MVHVAPHALVGGLCSCYLHHLYGQKHGDPHQLQTCPDGNNRSEGITQRVSANAFRENVALRLFRFWKTLDVLDMLGRIWRGI